MHAGLNDLDEFIDSSASSECGSDSDSDTEYDPKREEAESLFQKALQQLPVDGFKFIELMLIVRAMQEQLYLTDSVITMVFLLLSTMFCLGPGWQLPTFTAARKRFRNLIPEGSQSFVAAV